MRMGGVLPRDLIPKGGHSIKVKFGVFLLAKYKPISSPLKLGTSGGFDSKFKFHGRPIPHYIPTHILYNLYSMQDIIIIFFFFM